MGQADNKTLAAYLNLQSCPKLTVHSFLEHTLVNLTGEIARQVFGCKHSEINARRLTKSLQDRAEQDHALHSFLDVSRTLRERVYARKGLPPEPLTTTEFVHFINDLLDVIRLMNWSDFVLFHDEANQLSEQFSTELLITNEEALNAINVTSVYAASRATAKSFGLLDKSFGHQIELGAFAAIGDLGKLLAKYYFGQSERVNDLPTTQETLNLIWQCTAGRPYQIQLLAGQAFREARSEGAPTVLPTHVRAALRQWRQQKPDDFPN
jgi:hypothetical protein